MTERMRLCSIGTGALGGLYGGLLANSGLEVHFLLRSDYQFVREHGLRVDSPLGSFHLLVPASLLLRKIFPVSMLSLVCWKTTQNDQLAEVLHSICRSDTIVLVLQNGLDVERAAAEVVGADRVLGGCCFLCSNKIGPGHIRHLDFGRIILVNTAIRWLVQFRIVCNASKAISVPQELICSRPKIC